MNATVGDIAGNAARVADGLRSAREAGAELALFPELALTGYPPEDLLLREHFLRDAASALRELAGEVRGLTAIVGFPEHTSAGAIHNAAAVLAEGAVQSVYRKVHLPNYGVFDEQRYFTAGHAGATIDVAGICVGVTVCEDLWLPGAPASEEAAAGASLIVNVSASPYHAGKGAERERLFGERAREHSAYVAFCALVGGQDELVFDGHSFVLDATGEPIARAVQFEETLLVCDVDLCGPRAGGSGRTGQAGGTGEAGSPGQAGNTGQAGSPGQAGNTGQAGSTNEADDDLQADASTGCPSAGVAEASTLQLHAPIAPEEAEVYAALCLGLRDYVQKNGFRHVVLGLSGGIDSALVACLAADALGPEWVSAAVMPSPYSSTETQADARALAANLGVRLHELEIAPVMEAYAQALSEELAAHERDLTEENLQARIRGNLLMALSNKFGWLVLTTGNKSEMSVGYTTLYGDLAGGLAVIKDVPKTLVYRLCGWRNSMSSTPIPASIIERAPSAELRPEQRDEDSLPPYALLDRILRGYIELDLGREQLLAQGLPEDEVDRTIRLVDLAEYKRRQAPPGIKVTTRAFGRDRRMPITNRYRG